MTRKPSPIDPDLQRDRYGHNGDRSTEPHFSRITYLASAKGYVMARRPGRAPFVISAALWRSFDYWPVPEQQETRSAAFQGVSPSVPCGVADAHGWSCSGEPADCSGKRQGERTHSFQFGGGRKGGKTAAAETLASHSTRETLASHSPADQNGMKPASIDAAKRGV